jgi:hypothetical protein
MRVLVKRATALLTVLVVLSGCAQSSRQGIPLSPERQRYLEQQEAIRQSQSVPVVNESITCYGHGAGYIYSFYVQETIHGQFSRGMIWGGGANCGVVMAGYPVPITWTPGMKVKVRWNRPIKGEDNWIEKTTTIPRYEKAAMLIVHFFPNDEVRVVVSNYYPESRYHPIPPDSTVPPPEVD